MTVSVSLFLLAHDCCNNCGSLHAGLLTVP